MSSMLQVDSASNLIYSAPLTLQAMEGEILRYQTDSDEESVGDAHIDLHRQRGKGRSWSFVIVHDNLQSAFTVMNNSNVPVVTQVTITGGNSCLLF